MIPYLLSNLPPVSVICVAIAIFLFFATFSVITYIMYIEEATIKSNKKILKLELFTNALEKHIKDIEGYKNKDAECLRQELKKLKDVEDKRKKKEEYTKMVHDVKNLILEEKK